MKHGAAVIVTYEPELGSLRNVIREVQAVLPLVVVVDNGSSSIRTAGMRRISDQSRSVELILSERNRGIGWAQNMGAAVAAKHDAQFILFLDQDTAIDSKTLEELFWAASVAREMDGKFAAIGPALDSVESGVEDSAHRLSHRPFLASSGSIVPMEALASIGGFREDYFIDHVDKEWGLRAGALGLKSYCVVDLRVGHALGDRGGEGLGKWRRFHTDPVRDYYLVRNEILLWRDLSFSAKERLAALSRLVRWSVVTVAVGNRKCARTHEMITGAVHGLLNRSGSRLNPNRRRTGVPFPV